MSRFLLPFAALVTTLLLLSSCATLTKEECLVTDWQALGQRDGAAGQPLNYFAKHVKACAKTNATPDQTLWTQGHTVGARQYCTPQNGLTTGNDGRANPNICAPDLQAGYQSGYALGRERYALIQRRQSFANQLTTNRSKESALEKEMEKGEITEATGAGEIRILRRDNRDLRRRADDVDFEIDRLDRRIREQGLAPPPAPAPLT